ncbi:MAG: hypothetical protein ACKO37_05425 [Vampirovibrionales bacterium]
MSYPLMTGYNVRQNVPYRSLQTSPFSVGAGSMLNTQPSTPAAVLAFRQGLTPNEKDRFTRSEVSQQATELAYHTLEALLLGGDTFSLQMKKPQSSKTSHPEPSTLLSENPSSETTYKSQVAKTLLGSLLESRWREEQPVNQLQMSLQNDTLKGSKPLQNKHPDGYVAFQTLSLQEATKLKAKVQAMVKADHKANITPEDEQKVEEAVITQIPIDQLKRTIANGTDIIVSDTASHLWSELKGDGPNNSLEGQTFDQTPAVFAPDKNQIAVFIDPLKKFYPNPTERQHRTGSVVRHEMGHALDYSQKGDHPFSSSEGFRQAYQKDLQELKQGQNTPQRWLYETAPQSLKNSLRYYASEKDPSVGRKEAFAELVATVSRGGTDLEINNLALWMPNSAKYVRQFLGKQKLSPYTYTERLASKPPEVSQPASPSTQTLIDEAVKKAS